MRAPLAFKPCAFLCSVVFAGLLPGALAECVTPTDGMVITSDTVFCSGTYYLPSGFTIAANNVTVQGDDTVIYGNDVGNGVAVDGRHHVTILNLTVRNYYNGIHLRSCDYARIEGCTVADTYNDCRTQPCVFLDIFDDPEPPGNSYGHAIWLRYCDHAVIRQNQVGNQQNGISLFDCDDALVEYNQASRNNGWGITLYNTNHSTIQYNTADDCIRIGSGHIGGDAAALLMVMGSSFNQILDNSFVRGGDGLFLAGYRSQHLPCANNYFARNDCSESPNNGFEATFSYGNVFEDNISDRCNYGYWLGYSWLNEVRGNQINDCYTAGIAIEHGNNNIIEENTMLGNYRGIWLWTDPDNDLVQVFPELKDSHTYFITGNVICGGYYGLLCEATGTNRYSYNYTVVANQIDENSYGIRFSVTTDSNLYSNFIRHNTVRGASFSTSPSNVIFNNYLHNHVVNAQDNAANTWNIDKTSGTNIVSGSYLGGNFWSDYAGLDTNGDGLGDTNLPHTSGGYITVGGDWLPLVWNDPDCNLNGVADAGEPDCNGNGTPDDCDIDAGVSQDCNANGVPDECDIGSGFSSDTNGDGIPDECQDCNANGIPDPVDIGSGTSQDCNSNGTPDECELIVGGDCNSNGIPDDCDLAFGGSADCNSNGLPDECEGADTSGLLGSYYDNSNFTGLSHYRVDATIDFIWGNLAPWPDFGANTFSVRWTGLVRTAAAGTYSFYTFTDDGARLWVNGRLIIDRWVVQGPTEVVGTIELHADTWYPIVMEYFDNNGGAAATLYWKPPGAAKTVIPAIRLRPDQDCDSNGTLDRCDVAGGAAPDCNANASPDACDIASGISQDLNNDGIPDECADCNNNGIPDWLDILSGASQDCNSNGIPDECEPDCNANGVPDDCDLVPRIAFHPAVAYPNVPSAVWLAVGDVSLDNAADIAVATGPNTQPLWLMYNDGSGGFPTHGTASAAAAQHAVALADFTGDGKLDIAVAENVNRRIRVLRNDGGGVFTEIHLVTCSADPVSLAAAKLDGDEDIDLVAGFWAGFIYVLKNNGNGTFAAPLAYSIPGVAYVVALGDLDGDNDNDVAVANLTGVVVRKNNGDGTLGGASTYPANGSAACVGLGDFDGDGRLDIAAANEHHDSVSILMNQGDGTFAPAVNYPVGANSRFLVVADFDQQGDPDVATANAQAAYISILQNKGDGTFEDAVSITTPQPAGVITAGRLDANTSFDVVVNMTPGGIAVLRNAATPVSQDCNQNSKPDECDIADGTSTDLNGNGIPDECDGLGDMDCDGTLNFSDINPFVLRLSDPDLYHSLYPNCPDSHGDINGDGQVDFDDINPFVTLLSSL